ncbi:MAG: acetylxylan esterase, partial [bacterium]|nr:acetylxylan esterase [bacterium]
CRVAGPATGCPRGFAITSTMYELVIPSVEGRHVWGYCSVPNDKSKAPFPVKVNVPGAGPASWGCDRNENEITLKVNVHYYDPVVLKTEKHKSPKCLAVQKEEDMAWAKKYPVDFVRYTVTGIAASREEYFYYGIILAANRAVNWVAARPDIDRTRFRYSGGSQGGGFGLILTGLNKNITAAAVFVPAITDLLSSRISNRESGWPRLIESQKAENRATAAKHAPYFCGVNFARQITVPIRFEVGFIDTVCPPHAGHAAYNVCPSKDKDILYGIGQGHSVLQENKTKMHKWLQATQAK